MRGTRVGGRIRLASSTTRRSARLRSASVRRNIPEARPDCQPQPACPTVKVGGCGVPLTVWQPLTLELRHSCAVRVPLHPELDLHLPEPLRQLADQQHPADRMLRLQQAHDQLQRRADGRARGLRSGDADGPRAGDRSAQSRYEARIVFRLVFDAGNRDRWDDCVLVCAGMFTPSCIAHCQSVSNEHPAALWGECTTAGLGRVTAAVTLTAWAVTVAATRLAGALGY